MSYKKFKNTIVTHKNIFKADFKKISPYEKYISEFLEEKASYTRSTMQEAWEEGNYSEFIERVIYHQMVIANLTRMLTSNRTHPIQTPQHIEFILKEREMIKDALDALSEEGIEIPLFANEDNQLTYAPLMGLTRVETDDSVELFRDYLSRVYKSIALNTEVVKKISATFADIQQYPM